MMHRIARLSPTAAFATGMGVGFIATVVAGLGLGALLAFVLPGGGGGRDEVQSTVVSPDRLRTAVLYLDMGGGAAGWCERRAFVASIGAVASSREQLKALPFDSLVFTASCGSDVRMAWHGPAELDIAYTLGDHGVRTFARPTTPDGLVRLRYAPMMP